MRPNDIAASFNDIAASFFGILGVLCGCYALGILLMPLFTTTVSFWLVWTGVVTGLLALPLLVFSNALDEAGR